MDGFTDVLSQHFNSTQEMITANSQADAKEMQNLQEQVEKYEGVLDRINETVDSLDKKISEIQPADVPAPVIDTEEYTSKLTGVEGKLADHIHKENVRVYRNVQASVVDELSKQTEALTGSIKEIMSDTTTKVSEGVSQMSEKVDALSGRLDAIEEKYDEKLDKLQNSADKSCLTGKGKAVLPVQIIMFILVIADLAINVLKILGII